MERQRSPSEEHGRVVVSRWLDRLGRDLDPTAGPGPSTHTLREIRDELGISRLTPRWRRLLTAEAQRRGIVITPPINDAGLDAPLVVGRPPAAGRSYGIIAWRLSRRALAAISAAVGAVAAVVTLILYFAPHTHSLAPMAGDINVLVAGFSKPSGRASRAGTLLARSLVTTLAAELPGAIARHHLPGQVDVEGPSPDFSVRTSTDVYPAASLATRLNASVVVYGVVTDTGTATQVAVSLYISPNWLPDARELAGPYVLGGIAPPVSSLQTDLLFRANFRREVSLHLTALGDFLVGLSLFHSHDWADARSWFSRAAESPHWPSNAGRALADVFHGNASLKLRDWHDAAAAFRSAEVLMPNSARAQLGAAQVMLNTAEHGCDRTADARGLGAARIAFEHAMVASRGVSEAAREGVLVRARLGEARTDVCLSQAGKSNLWARATSELEATLTLAASDPHHHAEEVAEAHANLGLVRLGSGTAHGVTRNQRRAAMQAALSEFQLAVSSTPIVSRKAVFERIVRELQRRLTRT